MHTVSGHCKDRLRQTRLDRLRPRALFLFFRSAQAAYARGPSNGDRLHGEPAPVVGGRPPFIRHTAVTQHNRFPFGCGRWFAADTPPTPPRHADALRTWAADGERNVMNEINGIKAQALVQEAAQRLTERDLRGAAALADRALTLDSDSTAARQLKDRVDGLSAPLCSVIIPTCNRLDILKACLACLERQTLPPSAFEVLVIDDASTDETANFLTSYAPPFAFRCILMPRRGGPAKARNAGIRSARGEVVHILNDDALIEPQVLHTHLALHQALADTPVAVLGRFDFAPPFTDTLWGYTLQHSDLLFRFQTFTHNGLHGGQSFYSCNISTPRCALIQAGLFDEAFTGGLWGAEDMEFGMRLGAMSVPVLFRDDSRSVHVHDVGVEGLARTALVRGGGAVWFFAKHGGRPHYATLKAEDVVYWRHLPARLTERLQRLHAVLAQTESLRPRNDGSPPPYLRREDFAICRLCYRLWAMRTRELLQAMDEVEASVHAVLAAVAGGASVQECAPALYPAMLFIRFFHDTIGVCGADTIRHFCPNAPLVEAAVPSGTPIGATADAVTGAPSALPTDETCAASSGMPSAVATGGPARRVLLACNFFWPSVGGTELFVERLGLELRALGHEVEIACRWQENRTVAMRHGMPIHALRCHGTFAGDMGPDAARYRELVRRGNYDAVIVLAHPDNWACHLLRDLPAPRPRLILLPSINAENMAQWSERGVLETIAQTLRQADICVAVSQHGHDRDFFTAQGLPQVFIPHAVEPNPAPWDMRARLDLPRHVPLLACVGNFWLVKNQAALLQRFAAQPLHGKEDWRLVLAGGALPWEAERAFFAKCWQIAQTDPRLRILGPLPPEEATALIRDADLLLVPSLGESAGPLVVLEAMAQGTPWIATPQCNAVHDEGGGIIADLDDFPQVAEALLARPDLASRLGANGRAHWERCFRWELGAPLFDALVRGRVPAHAADMPDDLRAQRAALERELRG